MRYLYDFGDGWDHEIQVEQILPLDPATEYPTCLEGSGACPLEDSGGPWRYNEILEILRDPEHPEHLEMSVLFEADFNPEYFDLDDTNAQLRDLLNETWS